MEKLLHLYKYVDGVNDTPFPSKEQQAALFEFKYDAKRMGNVPVITGTLMHPLCLDELWGNNEVYVSYNGERYFIKQTPTSSYSNDDTRYKHECDFVSERVLLNDVYFYDVVTSDVSNDKPVSNSSDVVFYGDIHELAKRLNYSLQYADLEYSVVVDDGITSESKLVSFQKQFFANVLQEGYKLFEIPYYYVGKVIHFGYTNNTIDKVFSYGVQDALLSISKNNITQRIVNRITGIGSADNIPYYYPNFDPKGESKVLYNGKANDLVGVENLIKYKKVKLGDTFSYTYEGDRRVEYVDKENYVVEREPELVSENYEQFIKRYELSISFPLNIEVAADATVVLDYDQPFLKNFVALVYRGAELVTRLTSLGTYYGFRVREGYTNITISLTFEFGFDDEKQEVTMADIPDIVDSLVVSIYSDVQGYEQWLLNKETNKVSLSDYGLKLNFSPSNGDKITFKQLSYIPPQPNLMPPIYRETLGAERFYNALNNIYYDKILGEYYSFDNPFIIGKNKEDDISFDDIKPSIKGIFNANGLRIDMFSEFAYDEDDNDEFDEAGNYLHPYFFGKLRLFDGEFGFNLFDHAIEEDEMVISMTSGSCGGCNFVIGVDDKTQKNTVQVDENGNLKRDVNGNVLYGSPQNRQNDTSKYEVWVALKKDIETFGVIMPNATNNYKPITSDTFVILHIDLPNAYILAAEERLREELIKYMKENNSEKFNFSLSFSRIFFAENPTILAQLNENSRIKIAYNNNIYTLYISSYSYNMSNDSALPEVKVELSEELPIIKESVVKQLANASRYLNQEVKKVNVIVATTNTNVAKTTATAQVSITQINTRIDDIEKTVRTIQEQGVSGLDKTKLEEYLTTNQYAKKSDIPSLSGYATEQWVIDKKYALASDLTALRTDFDNLNNLLNSDVSGVINTWGEVVDFLDEYSGSEDLATILSGMNAAIGANTTSIATVSNRVKTFEDVIGIDSNGDVYIKGTRNFYTEGGTIGMGSLGEGGSGEVATPNVTIQFDGSEILYTPDANGIITLPAYPEGTGGGLDISAMWQELYSVDATKVIDSSHIPDLSNKYLGVSSLADWAKAATKPSYAFNEITSKPTTLAGYGITDALPLRGGIITSASYQPLILHRTAGSDAAPFVVFENDDKRLGMLGISAVTAEPIFYRDSSTSNPFTILHSDNYSDYALPLSGGTISVGNVGDFNVLNTAQGVSTIHFYAQKNGANYDLGYLGIDVTNGAIYMTSGGAQYPLIHSGNIGDYAMKYYGNQGAIDFNNVLYNGIQYTSGSSSNNGKEYGVLASFCCSDSSWQIVGGRSGGDLLYRSGNGTSTSWGNWKTIAFADSNVASADYATNAGNADTLDGYHHDSFVKSYIDSTDNFTRFTDRAFFQTAWINGQGDFGTLVIPTWIGNNTESYYTTELRFDIRSVNPKIRITDPNGTSDWYTLARTVDNVASATKLQTARYIFGRLFDGSGDVSGNLHLHNSKLYWHYDADNYCIYSYHDGTTTYLNIKDYGNIVFHTSAIERMRIKSNGNVLIGTTTDSGYKLDVNGNISSRGDFQLLSNSPSTTSNSGKLKFNALNTEIAGPYIQAINAENYGRARLAIFQHNAANYSSATEVMSIMPNGNVLIGTTTDNGAKLQVNGSSYIGNSEVWKHIIKSGRNSRSAEVYALKVIQGTDCGSGLYDTMIITSNDVATLRLSEDDGTQMGICAGDLHGTFTSTHDFRFFTGVATNQSVYNGGGGEFKVGINYGGAALYVNGSLTATGDIISEGTIAMAKLASSSDRSLKNNIAEVSAEQSMGIIRQLRPTTWDWKKDGKKSYGLIAQEVEPIVPEMVVGMGHLHLEYNQLHAFEIGAIKHIDSEVDKLKKDLVIANERIEVLENELKQYRRNA